MHDQQRLQSGGIPAYTTSVGAVCTMCQPRITQLAEKEDMFSRKDALIRELNADIVKYSQQASGQNSDAQIVLIESKQGWTDAINDLATRLAVAEAAAQKAQTGHAGLKEQVAVRHQRIEVLDKLIAEKDKTITDLMRQQAPPVQNGDPNAGNVVPQRPVGVTWDVDNIINDARSKINLSLVDHLRPGTLPYPQVPSPAGQQPARVSPEAGGLSARRGL